MSEKGPVVDSSTEEMLKAVQDFDCFIVFVDSDNHIQHTVGYQGIPRVSALKHLFKELQEDKTFAITNVDKLRVDIISKEEFESIYRNTEEQKSE